MAPTFFKKVPATEQEWQGAAMGANVIGKTLKGYKDFHSASKITQEQFLLLRAICKSKKGEEFNPSRYNLDVLTARVRLNSSTGFTSYIREIRNGTWGGEDKFSMLRTEQGELLESPNPTTNKLTDIDETSINSSFINLLRSITTIAPNTDLQWRSTRIRLVANFGRVGNNKIARKFTAITDGQLQEKGGGKIRAIVECKRRARSINQPQVDMQECAQMVAWIKEFPGSNLR